MSSRKQMDSKKHAKLLNSSSEGEEAQSSQENSSSNKHNSEQEYTVEAVRAHRGVGTSREYYIKWENYSEDQNTWEPLSHLNNIKNMIKDYESKIKTQKPLQNSKDSSSSDSKLIQLKKKPAAKTITKDAQKLLNQTSNLQAKTNIDLSNATNILKDHNNSQIQFEKQTNNNISKGNLLFGKTEQIIAAVVQENKQTSQPNNSLLATVLNGSMSKKHEKVAAGVGQGMEGGELITSISKSSNSTVELGKRSHSQMESLLSQLSQDTQPIKKTKTDTTDTNSNTTPAKTAGTTIPAMNDSSISTSISKSVITSNDAATSSSSLMQAILNKETAKTNQDGSNNNLIKKNGSNNLMNMLLSTKPQQQQQQQQPSSSKLERMLAEESPTKETNNEESCEIPLIMRQNKELLTVLEGESEMFKRQFAQSANSNGKDDDDDDNNDDDYDDDDYNKSKNNNNNVLFDLQKDLVEFKGGNLASIKASKASIQAVVIKELNQELFKKSKIAQDVVSRQQIQESYVKFEYLVPFSFRNEREKKEKKGKDKVKEIKTKENALIQKDNQSERQRQGEYKDDDGDGRIVAEEEQGQQVEIVKRDSMVEMNLQSSIVVNTASELSKVKGTMNDDNCSDRIIDEELKKMTDNQFRKNSEISMNEELDDKRSQININTINISTAAAAIPNKLSISQEKQQNLNIPSFEQIAMGVDPLVINNNTQPFSDPFPNPPLIERTVVSQSQKSFQSDLINSQIKNNFSNQEKDILNLPETTNQKGQIKENLRDLNIASLEGAKQIEEQRILEEIITKKRRIDIDTPVQISNSSSLSQQVQVSSSQQPHHSTRSSDSANPGQEKTSLLPFTSPKDIQEKKTDNLHQSLKFSQEQELISPSIKSSHSKFSDPSQAVKDMDSMSLKHSTSPFSSQPYRDGPSIKSSSRHENSKSPSRKKDHKHRDKDSKSSRRSGRSRDRNRSSSKSKKDKKNKRSSNGRSRSRSPSMRIAPKNRKNSVSRSRSSSSLRISKNSSTQLGSSQTVSVKNGATIQTINQGKPFPTAPGPTKKVFNPFQRNTIYDEDEDDEEQAQEQVETIKKQSSGENTKDKHKNAMEKGKSIVKAIDPKDKDDDIWDDGDDDICSTSDKNSSFQKNSMVSYNVNPYDEEYSKPSVSQQQQQQQQQQQDNKSALNNSCFRRESGFDQTPKYNEKNNNTQNNSHNEYSINGTQGSSSQNQNSNSNLSRHETKKNDGFDRDDKEAWQKQQKSYSQQQYLDKENLKFNENQNFNRPKDDQVQGASRQDLIQVSKPKDPEEQRKSSTSIQSQPSETVIVVPPISSQILRDPRLKFRNSEQQKDNEKQLKEFSEKQQNTLKSLGEIGCPMLDAPARISHHLVWNNQMFFKVIWKPRESKIQMPPTFIEFVKVQESYPNILNQYVLSSLQKQNTFL